MAVAVAPAQAPNQPTGLAASATFQVVSLTWDAATGPSVTSYQILRQDITGGGGLAVHINSAPVGTSYDDSTDVDPENSYGYRIKARNAQGLSVQSNFASITTPAAPTTDVAPAFADNTGVAQSWIPSTAITAAHSARCQRQPVPDLCSRRGAPRRDQLQRDHQSHQRDAHGRGVGGNPH